MLALSTCTAPVGTFTRDPSRGSQQLQLPLPAEKTSENARPSGFRRSTTIGVSEEASRRLLTRDLGGKASSELQRRAADVRQQVNDLFSWVDRDSDGLISLTDLRRIFLHLDGVLPCEALTNCFRKDREDDFNYIDKDQFKDILLAIANNTKEEEDDTIELPMTAHPHLTIEVSTILEGAIEKPAPCVTPGRTKPRDGSNFIPASQSGIAVRRPGSSFLRPGLCVAPLGLAQATPSGLPEGGDLAARKGAGFVLRSRTVGLDLSYSSPLNRDVNSGGTGDAESGPHERKSISRGDERRQKPELRNSRLRIRTPTSDRVSTWPRLAPGNSVAPSLPVVPLTPKPKENKQAMRPIKQQGLLQPCLRPTGSPLLPQTRVEATRQALVCQALTLQQGEGRITHRGVQAAC